MNNKIPKECKKRLQCERQQRCQQQKKKKVTKTHTEVSNSQIPKARVYPWILHDLHWNTLGNMNHKCSKCGTLMWLDERINIKCVRNLIFMTCCANGKVSLPLFKNYLLLLILF